MKIAIVSASQRSPSISGLVGAYLSERIRTGLDCETSLTDLGARPLPMWDDEFPRGTDKWINAFGPVMGNLEAASALVLITPEWGGMATPAMKNFLLLAPPSAVAHKPALIVTVSGGSGGSYPVAELRMSASKNNRICLIPEHVIVRGAGRLVADNRLDMSRDPQLSARVDYSLQLLCAYAQALGEVRESGLVDNETYPFGM